MKIVETKHTFRGNHKNRSRTNMIVVHHAAGAKTLTAAQIHQMHLNRKSNGVPWNGIGYHYFIRWDGTIERGRPEWAVGAHSVPVNSESIGICMAGDFTKHEPSTAQINSLVDLIKDVQSRYNNKLAVKGHNETDATQCPGHLFPWTKVKSNLDSGGSDNMSNNVTIAFNGRITKIKGRIVNGRTQVQLSGYWVELRDMVEMIPGATIDWDGAKKFVDVVVPSR